jgi:stress response protein YsnF
VVEVRETSEEPVIAKTARVVEEVVIGREATERTETVKDTVRREEVEVSKDLDLKR